ncbi:hypothetical protein SDJN02_20666, partial [Cucurbita argyrosperma subsp. argyrosperma]
MAREASTLTLTSRYFSALLLSHLPQIEHAAVISKPRTHCNFISEEPNLYASDRFNINSQLEHLQAKYVGTGRADLNRLKCYYLVAFLQKGNTIGILLYFRMSVAKASSTFSIFLND